MSSDNTPLVVCYKGIKWFIARVQMFGARAFPLVVYFLFPADLVSVSNCCVCETIAALI